MLARAPQAALTLQLLGQEVNALPHLLGAEPLSLKVHSVAKAGELLFGQATCAVVNDVLKWFTGDQGVDQIAVQRMSHALEGVEPNSAGSLGSFEAADCGPGDSKAAG